MSTVNKLIVTSAIAVVTTAFSTKPVQAIHFTSVPHDSSCDVSGYGCKTNRADATTIDFNSVNTSSVANPLVFNLTNGGTAITVTYTYTAGTTLVRPGTAAGVAAEPLGDTTNFIAAGTSPNSSPITITFSKPIYYFGLYWGSEDSFNQIQFYKNTTDTSPITAGSPRNDGIFNGTDILTGATGDQSSDNQNRYVTFYTSDPTNEYFQKVTLTSNTNAFETDNHAFTTTKIPYNFSPGLGILALGAWGAVAHLKSKAKKSPKFEAKSQRLAKISK